MGGEMVAPRSVAKCNLREVSGSEFRVPWDEIGKELMSAHLKEFHGGR